MPVDVANQEYSRSEVLRVLSVTERQLKSWEKLGLVPACDAYGFSQLVALRTLARLRASNVPAAKIQRAVAAVRRKLQQISDPLTELRIYSEGTRVRVQLGSQKMEPESGQLLLDFDETELQRLVSIPSRSRQELDASIRKKKMEAENWFHKGIELEQSGVAIEQAIDAYKVAIALDPQLAAAMVNLGTIYFTSRNLDRAEKYYTRAIEANPEYALAHFNLGNLFDERGDRGRALSHYLAAIKIEPTYSDPHYNLALLCQTTGQHMKAIRYWRIYLRLDPNSAWAEIARRELSKLVSSSIVRGNRIDGGLSKDTFAGA
ncbi:MAG: tetratricopeptide repeat protein [Acidobacteriia bacterium]|nr:tetratricopeptide repeat protein [Terriglobia bacterium]